MEGSATGALVSWQGMTDNNDRSDVEESDDNPEYERFDALTRRLIGVPKSEVDAARTAHKGSGPSK